MADITAVAQTYDNAGAEITAARVSANAGRLVSHENFSTSGITRTYTGPYTQFGTRQLTFLKVVAVGSDGSTAVNFGTTYVNSGSDFSLAVRAIQTYAEIFAVGIPDATGFIVVVAADTANGADSGNTQAATFGLMEAAVTASTAKGGSAATTITVLTFDGVAIS
jgi:hypothetical protein